MVFKKKYFLSGFLRVVPVILAVRAFSEVNLPIKNARFPGSFILKKGNTANIVWMAKR